MGRDIDISKRALVVALALHLAATTSLLLLPPPSPQPRPSAAPASSFPDNELTIDVRPFADPSPPPAPAVALALALASAPAPAPAPAPALAPAPAPAPAPALAPGSLSLLSPPPPLLGLSLDGPNTFVTSAAREAQLTAPSPASPASRTLAAEPTRSANAILRDPSRQRERSLGLGPEGPVLRALGDATTASFAPVKGRAIFRAVADGSGMIVGLEVVTCDGSRDGWANAAELAREALKGKKLRMPSTATRATMRIEVVSELKMPSGHDPGVDVSILGVPITKGEGAQSTQVRILDPFTLSALAGDADPVDIGAKPRRVVHSRLLDSEVL